MTKKDRVDKGHTGQGISRRTDRAVRRAARASESAARAVTAPPVTRTMRDGEAHLTKPLVGMIFGKTEDLGRVLIMRTYFDQRGEIEFHLSDRPEWAEPMVDFDLELWWGRFFIGQYSKTIDRPGDTILFKLKEGRDTDG